MRKLLFVLAVITLAAGVCIQPASAAQDFLIACEGTESGGGGINRYQYTLQNISAGAVTLTEFFVGTGDPSAASYTFVPAAGFNVSIIPNDGFPPCNVTYTSGVKTPHGMVPPAIGSTPSAAVIYWAGSTVVPSMGTVTFAFYHPGESNDHEWFANGSAGWTISQSDQPMAGPLGVYTIGYVHAPNPPAFVPAVSGWGIVLLALGVLMAATWLLLRVRRSSERSA